MPTEAVRALIESAGYRIVDLPILQPANIVLDLAGESLRKRLFVTLDADGTEYCMRPDFTIPVVLHHMATGQAARRANYGYWGPVFRQRPHASGEFYQAGIESIGRDDREAADAEVLSLAIQAARAGGLVSARIRLGDSAIFSAVVDALDLEPGWRNRLVRLFGDTDRLSDCIAELADGRVPLNGAAGKDGFSAVLHRTDRASAQAFVEDLLAVAGIDAVGGRTPAEIADRFLEQAALTAGAGIGRERTEILRSVLTLRADPATALAQMQDLADDARLDLGSVLDAFSRRIDAMAKRDIDVKTLTFSGDFGRRIDYYSGFIFQIHDGDQAEPVVGGGRYDGLLAGIGADQPVPAVGAAIWLERLPGGGT